MRTRLALLLSELTLANPKVQILSGDHGYSLFDPVRKAQPKQFINVGVSEQSMVGMAAGMAKAGLRPIVYGLSAFIPIRVLEFIKMDVCYEGLPVIFLGDGAGLVYSTLGASHQCGEDMAALLPLPNMRVYSPADASELEYCLKSAMRDTENASYIRLGKADQPPVHGSGVAIFPDAGCLKVRTASGSVVVLATGSMVSTAVLLAEEFSLTVLSVPGISDLTAEALDRFVEGYDMVVTMEEHSLHGGLGSLVDRFLLEKRSTKVVHHFALGKKFTTGASTYIDALAEHGLAPEQVRAQLRIIRGDQDSE